MPAKRQQNNNAAAAKQQRRPRRQRQQQQPKRKGAFVNTRKTVNNNTQTRTIHEETGTDQLFHVADVSKLKRGDTICEAMVEPPMMPRMKLVGSMYQMIKYVTMTFDIVSQSPTSQTGGYVVAFVKDANDEYVNEDGTKDIPRLIANDRSRVVKAWESTSFTIKDDRWFYTSPGTSERLYSPGKLIVVMDGAATQPGSFTITCKWKIQLKNPTMEAPNTMVPSLIFKDVVVVATNGYIYAGAKNKTSGDADILDWSDTDVGAFDTQRTYLFKSPGSFFEWQDTASTDDNVIMDEGRCIKITYNAGSKIWEAKLCKYDGTDLNNKPKTNFAQEDNFLPGDELVPYVWDDPLTNSSLGFTQTMTRLPGLTSRRQPWSYWKVTSMSKPSQSSMPSMEETTITSRTGNKHSPTLQRSSSYSRSSIPEDLRSELLSLKESLTSIQEAFLNCTMAMKATLQQSTNLETQCLESPTHSSRTESFGAMDPTSKEIDTSYLNLEDEKLDLAEFDSHDNSSSDSTEL